MDDTKRVYKLKYPVVIAETTIAELAFRRPRSKDFRELPADESRITIGHFLTLAAKLANQPSAVLDALDPEDMGGVMEVVSGFFPDSLATGV
jgi:hypothetical protein